MPAVQLIHDKAIASLPPGIGAPKGQALAKERFDQLPDGGTVHIEDSAQISGVYPEEKYKKASTRNIAQVIAAEGTGAESNLACKVV